MSMKPPMLARRRRDDSRSRIAAAARLDASRTSSDEAKALLNVVFKSFTLCGL